MANPANITVPAEANPAVVKVGPWITFVVHDKDGNEVAHMDASSDGTQPHTIAYLPEAYPLTIIFKQNDAPAVQVVATNAIPEGAVALN